MWKDWLAELESLTEASGINAFRVATICRKVLSDRALIDGEWKGKRDDAELVLSKFSKRMAMSLDSMLTMLDFFPKEEDWDGADLEALRWQAAAKLNERQRARREKQRQQLAKESPVTFTQRKAETPPAVVTSSGPSMAEVSEEIAEVRETLRKEVKQAEVKAIDLQRENSKLRAELQQVKLAYAQLQAENAKLRDKLRMAKSKSAKRDRLSVR